MTTQQVGPERVYRGLLRLYPARFRARFSDDMVQLFGDQLRAARTEGPPAAVAATWIRAISDLAVTATSETHPEGPNNGSLARCCALDL